MTRVTIALAPLLLLTLAAACAESRTSGPPLTEVRRGRAGHVEVVLLAPTDALKPTRNYCTIEFRSAADQHLIDVGAVGVHTSMTMEGEPMGGFVTEPKEVATGRYTVEMVLAMKGDWTVTVDWMGPAGRGTVTFPSTVR